jgi:hypothetical protein
VRIWELISAKNLRHNQNNPIQSAIVDAVTLSGESGTAGRQGPAGHGQILVPEDLRGLQFWDK